MRTIILQQVPSPSGASSYWSINENGRQIDGLGPDELLWAVSQTLQRPDGNLPFGGAQTAEQMRIKSFRDGALCGLRHDISAIQARGRATLAPGCNEFIEEDNS